MSNTRSPAKKTQQSSSFPSSLPRRFFGHSRLLPYLPGLFLGFLRLPLFLPLGLHQPGAPQVAQDLLGASSVFGLRVEQLLEKSHHQWAEALKLGRRGVVPQVFLHFRVSVYMFIDTLSIFPLFPPLSLAVEPFLVPTVAAVLVGALLPGEAASQEAVDQNAERPAVDAGLHCYPNVLYLLICTTVLLSGLFCRFHFRGAEGRLVPHGPDGGADGPGEAEVAQFDPATGAVAQEDVLGFDVTVDEAERVKVRDGAAQLGHHPLDALFVHAGLRRTEPASH